MYLGPGTDGIFGKVFGRTNPKPTIPLVCLRGAIHGYQGAGTPVTILAEAAVLDAINELYGHLAPSRGKWITVPTFNDDPDTTFEMVEQAVKLGLIKLETGWEPNPEVTTQLKELNW